MAVGPVSTQAAAPSDAERWHAVESRDVTADESFVYAVLTTGVYCRPSCASRPARRDSTTRRDRHRSNKAT